MRRHEAFHFGQLHEVGQYDAITAPISAHIDQHTLAAFLGAREGRSDRGIGVRVLVIRRTFDHGEIGDRRDAQFRRAGGKRSADEKRQGQKPKEQCGKFHRFTHIGAVSC